jgi:hypothetical protein
VELEAPSIRLFKHHVSVVTLRLSHHIHRIKCTPATPNAAAATVSLSQWAFSANRSTATTAATA